MNGVGQTEVNKEEWIRQVNNNCAEMNRNEESKRVNNGNHDEVKNGDVINQTKKQDVVNSAVVKARIKRGKNEK